MADAYMKKGEAHPGGFSFHRPWPLSECKALIEVLRLAAEGKTTYEIAVILGRTPKTVNAQRFQLLKKLDAHSMAQAVAIAMRQGLIQ